MYLKTLRARRARREVPLDWHVPDPVVTDEDGGSPEQAALLAGDIGLALLAVLDALGPAERLAFVLHDMFAVPYGQIAVVLARTPAATGSSPAAPGGGCGGQHQSPIRTPPVNARSSTRSSPSPARETSTP